MSTHCTEPSSASAPRVFLDYSSPEAFIHAACKHMLALADSVGQVVTIEQIPLQPLAMGHYETVVHVRPARSKA